MSLSLFDSGSAAILQSGDPHWLPGAPMFMLCFVAFYVGYVFLSETRRYAMMGYVLAFNLFFAYKASLSLALLLPIVTIISWTLTRCLSRSVRHRRLWLVAAIGLELFPLLWYKCSAPFAALCGLDPALWNGEAAGWGIPVGIGFFTLQAVSYTVDVWRGTFRLRTDLCEYAFYLTFFPLLLAGPITRAGALIPQLKQRVGWDKEWIYGGLFLLLLGLVKKAVANYLAVFNDWVFDAPAAFSGFENLMAVLGYTVQIYLDFSAYSDLSIGLAAMMGLKIPENFENPYCSRNLTEFWHRWHISLSSWLRDYVYIPLGGNRRGSVRMCLNCLLTMWVAGFWHGVSWMFLAWGTLHGVGLIVQKLFSRRIAADSSKAQDMGLRDENVRKGSRLRNLWCCGGAWLLTFVFLMCSWVLFRASDADSAWAMVKQLFTAFDVTVILPFVTTRPLWLALCVCSLLCIFVSHTSYVRLKSRFIRLPWWVKLLCALLVWQCVQQLGSSHLSPFIYMQF
ncbi:MAG: MBOAT family O-acyltransferase [Alloprevotella sp.]